MHNKHFDNCMSPNNNTTNNISIIKKNIRLKRFGVFVTLYITVLILSAANVNEQ